MKSAEQLVASIREFRFAIDRLSAETQDEEISPATRQALIAQAKALQADIDRLIQEIGEQEAETPALLGE
jgi:Sec-independent protein translocase protein TatA